MDQLMIPGCELTENSLRVPKGATDSDLRVILRFLRRTSGALNWWIGDFILQGAECPDRVEGVYRVEERMRMLMEELAMPEIRVKECVDVAREIAPAFRRKSLSWTHHREALATCGSLDDCAVWLDRAVVESWTVADMIRAIHEHKQCRLPGTSGGQRRPSAYRELFAASSICARLDVSAIDPDDLKPVVESTERLWIWLCQLRARAGYDEVGSPPENRGSFPEVGRRG